jgi:hypothetical protein
VTFVSALLVVVTQSRGRINIIALIDVDNVESVTEIAQTVTGSGESNEVDFLSFL